MRSFRKLSIATLTAVYVLILVGGIVRSTGSGMGCPDWPKCFGRWVPPSSQDDLPENYKEIYSEYRHKKNLRFAKYLSAFGFDETADKILADKTIREEADFNPTKTLIEYANRVVGVIIGFFVFGVFVASLKLWRTNPRITTLSFVTFVLVGFQGWIGSFVVSSNLTPWTVTVHMLLALIIVALLIVLIWWSGDQARIENKGAFGLTACCLGVLVIQIVLGTNVREAIDSVAASMMRTEWISAIEAPFFLHRTFSWIVLIVHVLLILKLQKTHGLKPFPLSVILLILGTILTGAALGYLGMPAWLQPVHLLIATVTFGVLFLLLLKISGNKVSVNR